MTAKEALRDYMDGLTEDDAAELLQWIEGGFSPEPLTAERVARVRRSLDQLEAGQFIDQETVEKMFGATG